MQQIKQGTTIVAAVDFQFKGASNRTTKVRAGDEFVITNPAYDQKSSGLYKIDRRRIAKLNLGHAFTWDMLVQFFSVNNLPPSYFKEPS
jgi:hypothetical protein